MNQTVVHINMTVHEDHYSTKFKISVGLVSPILSFFIIFLYWGIIYYEKFGHDPLKRDLSNMLFSSLCKTISIGIVMLMVVINIRIIFGPILFSIAVFCYFLALNFTFYWHSVNYEIIIYKFMTMCTKKNIVNINDAMWHSILSRTNVLCAFLLSSVIVLMSQTSPMIHFLSSRTFIINEEIEIHSPSTTL